MKRPEKWRKVQMLALSLALLLSLAAPAAAAEPIDQTAPVSLTVIDRYDDTAVSGVDLRLYRVADVKDDLTYTTTGAFAHSHISMDTSEALESWADRAVTLEAYVVEHIAEGDAIQPAATATTDQDGMAVFADLTPGMYLLVGKQKVLNDTIHKPQAALIALPFQEDDGTWNYDPAAYLKSSNRPLQAGTVEVTAAKLWNDEGLEGLRPESVTLTLYQDETTYDTVTISAENGWQYTWDGLDPTSDWHLMERSVSSGYSVTAVGDSDSFVVTNTYRVEMLDDLDTPTSYALYDPDAPDGDPGSTASADGSQGEKLPQTGQLWWPVTLLSVAGLALLLAGWGIRRKAKNDHEA
jgi:LPXTG-motif cell wall-anchored protein